MLDSVSVWERLDDAAFEKSEDGEVKIQTDLAAFRSLYSGLLSEGSCDDVLAWAKANPDVIKKMKVSS